MRNAPAGSPDWADPTFFEWGYSSRQTLSGLLVKQLLPSRRQRTFLTASGWVLVLVSLGIGSAAYNTSSNILFLVLSIQLSALILSGFLSVINFSQLDWRLDLPDRLRAGGVGVAMVTADNRKRVFPTIGIWCEMCTNQMEAPEKVYLRDGLPAGSTRRTEWPLRPSRRGRCRVGITAVESEYPFGFLRRRVGREENREMLIWPNRIGYTFSPAANGRRHRSGATHRKIGQGTDLIGIRAYVPGDPPRLIHWKASAREGRLMVRQLSEESEDGYSLRFRSDIALTAGQFETLCSLACSLAEDLFLGGRLRETVVDDAPARPLRCRQDLDDFFDQLATAELRPPLAGARFAARGESQIVFRPAAEEGVAIYVGEQKAGEAQL